MAPAITLAAEAPKLSAANTGFMLICSALVLIMTPGLAASGRELCSLRDDSVRLIFY